MGCVIFYVFLSISIRMGSLVWSDLDSASFILPIYMPFFWGEVGLGLYN